MRVSWFIDKVGAGVDDVEELESGDDDSMEWTGAFLGGFVR